MKPNTKMASAVLAGLLSTTLAAGADTKFPDALTMPDALKIVVARVHKSDYQDLEITTRHGTFSGQFVKQAGNVIILKRKTGSMNLTHNKEKVQYIMIDAGTITGISFHTLE